MDSACTFPNCSCKNVGGGVLGMVCVASKSRTVPDPPSPSDLRAVMEIKMMLVTGRPCFGGTYVGLKVEGEPDVTLWSTLVTGDGKDPLSEARYRLARAVQQIMEEHDA